jgi:hypothetical protein
MSDCFQCSGRGARSKVYPDLVWCNELCVSVNYKERTKLECRFFRQASQRKIEAQLYYDNQPLVNIDE